MGEGIRLIFPDDNVLPGTYALIGATAALGQAGRLWLAMWMAPLTLSCLVCLCFDRRCCQNDDILNGHRVRDDKRCAIHHGQSLVTIQEACDWS